MENSDGNIYLNDFGNSLMVVIYKKKNTICVINIKRQMAFKIFILNYFNIKTCPLI